MNIFITIVAGGILAIMMFLNGSLARYSDPLWASFVTHFVGTLGALGLVMMIRTENKALSTKAPGWSYAGGILGALTVVIANITFNSKLGVSGSFVLMLLGQTVFSVLIDQLGWFGMKKRKVHLLECIQIILIITGSSILVVYGK